MLFVYRRPLKMLIIILTLIRLSFPINARPINKDEAFFENIQQKTNTQDAKQQEIPMNEIFTQRTPADGNDAEEPSEIQKAVCTVTAGEVKASAEAVTTKALKGVCGTNEMNKAFSHLENKLLKELELIEGRLTKELELIKNMISSNSEGGCNRTTTDSIVSKSIVLLQPIPTTQRNDITSNTTPKMRTKSYYNFSPIREKDMFSYSNSLLTEKDEKIFTYYWKIENFTKKIENNSDNYIQSSPTFSIKGKTLKVQASFQHLRRDFLYIQLVDASSSSLHTSTSSGRNSVILDTGFSIFKQIQSGNLKYKISVIDQNAQRGKDLISQEFDNHETGFLIPNSALLDSPFIKNDSILIKIFLYL